MTGPGSHFVIARVAGDILEELFKGRGVDGRAK
jgi:hypothetical protein